MEEPVRKVLLTTAMNMENVKTTKDRRFSNACIIDLSLDSVPDHVWQDIFEYTWRSSRNLWDRKLFVVGERLRLVTTPDEFGEKLEWIKQVIKETNKTVEAYNLVAKKGKERIEKETARQNQLEEETRVEVFKENFRKRYA